MPELADNNDKIKKKPRGKPFPKGVSGNPKGAPKRGKSWAELFDSIGELTGSEASEKVIKLWSKTFNALPEGITLKENVVLRVYAALLDDSNPRLLKEVMERVEGKVAQPIEGNIGLSWREFVNSDAPPDSE